MTQRLSTKCRKLCDSMKLSQEIHHYPYYVLDLIRALKSVDEVLQMYELNDHMYCKEYELNLKQWRDTERAFYKILKRLRGNVVIL